MEGKTSRISLLHRPEWQLAILLAVILLGFRLATGFVGHFGQDANEYVRFAKEIRASWGNGPEPGPFFWPLAFPTLGALLSLVVGEAGLALQLISIFSHALLIPATVALIKAVFPDSNYRLSAVYAFLFVGLSPFLFRNGLFTMTDSLSILLAVMAILKVVQYHQLPSLRIMLWAGFWAGLAGLVRYNNLFVLLVPAVMAFIAIIRHRRWADGIMAGLLAVAIVSLELIFHERPEGVYSFTDLWRDISPATWFQSSYHTHEGLLSYSIPNGVYMFMPLYHPGFFLLAIPLAGITAWKKMWKGNAPAIWLLATGLFFMLFTGMVHMQVSRLLLPVVPIWVVICFPAFAWLWGKVSSVRLQIGIILAVLGVQGGMAYKGLQPAWRRIQLEQGLVAGVQDLAGKKLYTFDMETAFATYSVPCEVESLWYREIHDAQKGQFLLLNLPVVEFQFKEYMPMRNYQIFDQQFSVDTVKAFREGWVLYEFR